MFDINGLKSIYGVLVLKCQKQNLKFLNRTPSPFPLPFFRNSSCKSISSSNKQTLRKEKNGVRGMGFECRRFGFPRKRSIPSNCATQQFNIFFFSYYFYFNINFNINNALRFTRKFAAVTTKKLSYSVSGSLFIPQFYYFASKFLFY